MSSRSDPSSGVRRRPLRQVSARTEIGALLLPLVLLGVMTQHTRPAPAFAGETPRLPHGVQALRVCADPNNLPFSNEKQQGFENRIASLIAKDLGVPVRYTWWPERRGFVRNTLKAGICDVIMEVPASYELTGHTAPYYRSTYVFVTRAGRKLRIRSFDDPALRHLRIGIHMMGDDYANSPAAAALARRGLAAQVVPFMIYGDYSEPDPPARLIRAVASDSIDVAIAWGPLAGYFAKRSPTPLVLTPVAPPDARPSADAGFAYSMSVGVRRADTAWRAVLDSELARRRADIRRILDDYGVPLVTGATR